MKITDKVEDFIEQIAGLNVLVIGETIIDEFIPVSYEGQSMKSICPVFKFEGKPNKQMGGASAIYHHLKWNSTEYLLQELLPQFQN